jgi:sensor c-di-GMP phosphodiesterase-like protein
MESVAQLVIKEYLKSYRRNRKATIIFTVVSIVISGIVGLTLDHYASKATKKAEEARRQANASYAQQIDNLNNVESSLKNLIEFIEVERQKLQDSEKLVSDLKEQEKLLRPVVEADRKIVESLLEIQNQKAQENLSRERWIGFGLGVISSVVASLLIAGIRIAINYRKRKSKDAESAA